MMHVFNIHVKFMQNEQCYICILVDVKYLWMQQRKNFRNTWGIMIHKVFAIFLPGMLKDHNPVLSDWYPICESKEIYKYNVFNKYSACIKLQINIVYSINSQYIRFHHEIQKTKMHYAWPLYAYLQERMIWLNQSQNS